MGIFGKLFSSDKKAPGSAQTPSEAEAREALDKGLEKTKSSFFDKIRRFVAARDTIDEDVLDLGAIECPNCGETLEFDGIATDDEEQPEEDKDGE